MGWGDYGSEDWKGYADMPKGKRIPWDEACKWLDQEFDAGFGAPGCPAIYAWTPSRVIFISPVRRGDGAGVRAAQPDGRNAVDAWRVADKGQ